MTEKSERWKSREWYGTTKIRWQQPAGSRRGQRSVDTWEHAKPKGKRKEVSAEYEALDALVQEKKITWTKSGRESVKREADLYTMLEKSSYRRKERRKGQGKLGDKQEAFPKRKEEEDEATCLMEDMRKKVEVAQHKSFKAEQSLRSALREYVDGYDKDQGRARTLMTKCW